MSETTMSCSYCEGDYSVEIEGPDYDVGLTGYSVMIDNTEFSTHDNDCPVRTMSQEEIEKIEYNLSIRVAEGYFNYEP